jgi:hypothetical protein
VLDIIIRWIQAPLNQRLVRLSLEDRFLAADRHNLPAGGKPYPQVETLTLRKQRYLEDMRMFTALQIIKRSMW